MNIKALMVDVDGVLIDGRPEDGLHWQTSMEEDFGLTPDKLYEAFFALHWNDIILGRAGLMERLPAALQDIAPQVSPTEFLAYWLEKDSRLSAPLLQELSVLRSTGIQVYLATNQEHVRASYLLQELSVLRSTGIQVYLATNQEHVRASYLMKELSVAESVDGIFYSAEFGAKKPDAEFFSKAQAAIGLAGEEILLIDDSHANVVAALEAGWQALHWTRSSSLNSVRNLCTQPPA